MSTKASDAAGAFYPADSVEFAFKGGLSRSMQISELANQSDSFGGKESRMKYDDTSWHSVGGKLLSLDIRWSRLNSRTLSSY